MPWRIALWFCSLPGSFGVRIPPVGAFADGAALGSGEEESQCTARSVCVVTKNRCLEFDKTMNQYVAECMKASSNAATIIAFSIQDHPNELLPRTLLGASGYRDFRIVHEHKLTPNGPGLGHLCVGQLAGGGPAFGVLGATLGFIVTCLMSNRKGPGSSGKCAIFLAACAFGAAGGVFGWVAGYQASLAYDVRCGSVAHAVYVRNDFPNDAVKLGDIGIATGERTMTTFKGSIAIAYTINGRHLVMASTHGTEGVRGKAEGSACPVANDPGVQREHLRVRDFRAGLAEIKRLRNSSRGDGVLWGGDFNPRGVDPQTGCPVFPQGFGLGEKAAAEAALAKQQTGRDILGEDPDTGQLTLLSTEIEDLVEVSATLKCPTYKKDKAPDDEKLFWCKDTEDSPPMYYKASKPPSWADRIFASNETWLRCGSAHRVAADRDHDAVVVACDILPPDCS